MPGCAPSPAGGTRLEYLSFEGEVTNQVSSPHSPPSAPARAPHSGPLRPPDPLTPHTPEPCAPACAPCRCRSDTSSHGEFTAAGHLACPLPTLGCAPEPPQVAVPCETPHITPTIPTPHKLPAILFS